MTIRSICGVLAIASGLIGHLLIVIGSFMFNIIANDLNHSYYEFAISSAPMKAIVLFLWILNHELNLLHFVDLAFLVLYLIIFLL